MHITHIRNATMTIHIGEHVVLVDPMLAPQGNIPSLKYMTSLRRRNPLVPLPKDIESTLEKVTHCLITHCQKGHFDHLDRAGVSWLKRHNIPVFCSVQDAEFLRKKGLKVQSFSPLESHHFLGGKITLVPCLHGRGFMGKLMAHGFGYFIECENEPSLYISGDTVLTDKIRQFVTQHQPDVIVIPAGGAKFDIGSDIIMGASEALEVGQLSKHTIVANHLEALDHCPVTRETLHKQIRAKGWQTRFLVPEDGEQLNFHVPQ